MASTEPRSGLKYAWGTGFNGWGGDMDANLLLIGRFGFHLSIKDRDLTAPPGTPMTGDTYICAAGSTADWAGKDNQVAIYDGATWKFGAPRIGWVAYIEDEEKLSAYKSSGWSAGVDI